MMCVCICSCVSVHCNVKSRSCVFSFFIFKNILILKVVFFHSKREISFLKDVKYSKKCLSKYIYINLRVVSFYYALKYILVIMCIFIINCKVNILK